MMLEDIRNALVDSGKFTRVKYDGNRNLYIENEYTFFVIRDIYGD